MARSEICRVSLVATMPQGSVTNKLLTEAVFGTSEVFHRQKIAVCETHMKAAQSAMAALRRQVKDLTVDGHNLLPAANMNEVQTLVNDGRKKISSLIENIEPHYDSLVENCILELKNGLPKTLNEEEVEKIVDKTSSEMLTWEQFKGKFNVKLSVIPLPIAYSGTSSKDLVDDGYNNFVLDAYKDILTHNLMLGIKIHASAHAQIESKDKVETKTLKAMEKVSNKIKANNFLKHSTLNDLADFLQDAYNALCADKYIEGISVLNDFYVEAINLSNKLGLETPVLDMIDVAKAEENDKVAS